MSRLPHAVVALLGLAILCGAPGEGLAQACFSSQARFYDDCNDSSGFYPPKEAKVQAVGGKTLMFINTNFQLRVFDLANPDVPSQLANLLMPFPDGCGLPFGCNNPHFQYEDTVYPVSTAVVGSVAYAFTPLNGYGWDLLKATVTGSTVSFSWFNTGYHPPGNGGPYRYGALFTRNGQLYLVGQMLDQTSVTNLDKSIRIYNLGTTPPSNLYSQMGSGVRVPVGGSNDGPGYSTAPLQMGAHQFFVKEVGAKRFLLVRTIMATLSQSWFAAFDISDPANPLPALFVGYASDPNLFQGVMVTEEGAQRLWVAKPNGGTNATVSIWGYTLSETNGALSLNQTTSGTWPIGSQQGAGVPQLAAGYGLLVFGWMQVGKAFAISPSGTLTPLPDTPGYTDLSINLEEPCQYWELARGYTGLAVYPSPTGAVYFYRGAMKEGRMIQVASSCLTLAPTAQMSVANTSASEAQAASCGTADADGFPGDTFTITDQSVGNITYKSLQIKDAAGTPVFSSTWTAAGGWNRALSWATANTQTSGLYTVTLTVGNGSDPDSTATKTIRLCDNPQAQLTVTPAAATYLQNETVTLGSASAGHPTSVEYYVWAPGATSSASQTGNQLTLASCGDYQVALVAHYAHAGQDSNCGVWYNDSNPNGYDSCTAPVTLPVGAARVSFKVMQGNVETDFPLVGQETTVQFTGQVATGYTPSYQWSATVNSQPVTVSGITDCTSATCTIPANTLTAGTIYTFTLHLALSPDPGSCAPGDASKTVTPTSATATMAIQNTSGQAITQAAVGQTVRLKVVSYQNLYLYELKFRIVGNESCESWTDFSLCSFGQCFDYRDVTFKNQGSATVQLVWNTGTGEQVMDSESLTLTPGSCPSSCTYSVTPTSASYGASGGTGSFTVTTQSGCAWQAVPDVSWIQVTSGSSGTGSGTVNYSVAANSGGSRQGKIRVPDGASSVGVTVLQSGSGGGGGGGNTLTITPNPAQVSTFPVTVTFSFSPGLSQTGDTLTFVFGDGTQQTLTKTLGVVISSTTHTYTAPPSSGNAFTVSASGTISGVSYSGYTQVTVACNAPSAPAAEFSWSPTQPRAGQAIQFTDQSTGGPTSWQWDFGLPLGGDTSIEKNPTFTYPGQGTYTVTLTVANCKGTSTKQKQITVLPACGESAVPSADFTWQPVEPTSEQVCQTFPDQCSKQPYTGQKVKLTDASTNNPTDWQWYDFQELKLNFTGQATVTVQWAQPGDKNVRLKAKNCVGWSAEKLKTVKIYADERPVTADFDPPANVSAGKEVTLTAKTGFAYGDPNEFTWEIQDPKPGEPNPVKLTGNPVNYAFKCRGQREVKLTAKRGTYTGTVTKTVEVSGQICGPEAFVAADAAKVPGLNNTLWRTDIRIFNPASSETRVNLYVLEAGKSNSAPPGVSNVPIPAKGSLALDNVLEFFRQQAGVDVSKAAIRVTFENPDGVPPVVVGRTYTDVTGGGTFGQLIPALEVRPGSLPREQWITGLRHDGTGGEGFRTNVSLYNLRPSEARLDLYLYDAQGQLKAVKQGKSIAPLGYEQTSILSFFNVSSPLGVAAVKLVLAQGSEAGFNGSVVDNRTGDASLESNEPPASGTALVIPGIARNTGAAGSVWRSSLTMTNPANDAKTFTVKFVPKGLPKFEKDVTLPGAQTLSIEDVVAWIVEPLAAPEASGTLVVYPKNGVFPVVSARTFNLAPNGGTFGQTLKVFHAGNAAGKDTGYRWLYLTGMASEDIARSNLGFVHVGGPTVNFKVWFYDEHGALLNPNNTPYTVALSESNPWDQDKLENRFRNKGWTLPANLRVISAVIQVEGGMGQAYASVIDNLTNDPIFIPAVPAP